MLKVSELAPYVGTGQGWDTQYESVLAALVWLHGGFGTCCGQCNRGADADYSETSVERARKRLLRSWDDDPVSKVLDSKEREIISHQDDIDTARLIDDVLEEQREAQECCGSATDDYPAVAAYKELMADMERTAGHIAKDVDKWRRAGHPLPQSGWERFAS